MQSGNKLAGLGILTAISASLCCIAPIIALLVGTNGLISIFSGLDFLRPYLIGLTVLMLSFAWYQKLKLQKQAACNCGDANERAPFLQTKAFLSIVTISVAIILAFPLYVHTFFQKTKKSTVVAEKTNLSSAEFTISGMTCSGCEEHVNQKVNNLTGIIHITVSYKKGNAIVAYDNTKVTIEQIEQAIEKTGYSVTAKKEIK
jgi:copper chaperone CopZ